MGAGLCRFPRCRVKVSRGKRIERYSGIIRMFELKYGYEGNIDGMVSRSIFVVLLMLFSINDVFRCIWREGAAALETYETWKMTVIR